MFVAPNPIVLQMTNRSTSKLKGILENVIVVNDSWEYPTDLMVMHTKKSIGGYPLILGHHWLAIVDAYIGCRSSDPTTSQGGSMNKLILYSPAKSTLDLEEPLWIPPNDLHDMTTSQGVSMKKLILYFPTKSTLDLEEPLWIPPNDLHAPYDTSIHRFLTIDRTLTLKEPIDYRMIMHFMQNMSPSTIQMKDCTYQSNREVIHLESNINPHTCHPFFSQDYYLNSLIIII
jgi:hypothetical protein